MITKGGQTLALEKPKGAPGVVALCRGEIPGAGVRRIALPEGGTFERAADTGRFHIYVLMTGDVTARIGTKVFSFAERVTFVPAPEEAMTVTAKTASTLLEIAWRIAPGDEKLRADYGTAFPLVVPYAQSIQYVDPNKSPKTISRMMIPHKMIPRFAIGSVESYGYDLVKPHSHPMLDQFFYSFPENRMDLIINGEKIPMGGDEIVHIPLGADHGVEVTGKNHLHYMWIDFLPDNEAGLRRLDERHKPTGTVRDLEREDKFRSNDR